jgi:predicted nucleic acid-binding protein
MNVVDTNILSEVFRPKPAEQVRCWMSAQPPDSLFTTTEAEMLYGVALLPAGRRRSALEKAVSAVFNEDFAGRVLGFDGAAARAFAEIAAARRGAGRPISGFDTQIAAIARVAGAAIATRDVQDFADCGVKIVNPWAPGSDCGAGGNLSAQ